MSMRILCVIIVCGLTACASKPRGTPDQQEAAARAEDIAPAPLSDPIIVTRYELGSYRYPKDASDRNETAIYRRTSVPRTVAEKHTGSEMTAATEYVPASFAPLPPSAELAAELATQKVITEELRAIKTAMVEMERKARAQYEALIRRTEEAVKARELLEAQVARVRDVEGQLRERLLAPPPPATPAPVAAPTPPDEVKW